MKNTAKTRVMNQSGRQLVTGVTVNQVLGLSRQERRQIRAMLHQAETDGAEPQPRAQLAGLPAWVHMLTPNKPLLYDAARSVMRKREDRLHRASDLHLSVRC